MAPVNVVIDLSHHNGVVDLNAAAQAGIVGVIRKATQGTGFQDPMYNSVAGRFPGLYAGAYLKELLGAASDPVLGSCWFWLSQYGPTAVVPANWKAWTMWQYTDGALGPPPYEVAGVGRCDRDMFNGKVTDLQALWAGKAAASTA